MSYFKWRAGELETTPSGAQERAALEEEMRTQYARALNLADTVWRSETDTALNKDRLHYLQAQYVGVVMADAVAQAVQAERERLAVKRIPAAYPERHARHLVKREGYQFVATPCYGMHSPWWVPMTPTGETDPIPMQDGDEHVGLDTLRARPTEPTGEKEASQWRPNYPDPAHDPSLLAHERPAGGAGMNPAERAAYRKGIAAAASFIGQWDKEIDHPYRMEDVVLYKFNLRKRSPRKKRRPTR